MAKKAQLAPYVVNVWWANGAAWKLDDVLTYELVDGQILLHRTGGLLTFIAAGWGSVTFRSKNG